MKSSNGILLYPFIALFTCIAFIYMSFGNLNSSGDVVVDEMKFVERIGNQFVLDGKSFYVNGWNSYWLMDMAVEEHTRSRMKSMFRIGAELGLSVCRTWAFNDGTYNALQISPGLFDDKVFKALDRVILEARNSNIRLLLCLANNLEAYGGKTQYVRWAWQEGVGLSSSNDSFFFDPSIRSYFKTFIQTVLNRKNHLTGIQYKDDPTIFAWELINEPQCMSDPSGDTLQDWIEEMAVFVKSIDKKHLLTIGLEGFYGPSCPPEKLRVNPGEWFSTLGSDFIRNSKVSDIDFASVHIYPDNWLQDEDIEYKTKYISKWIASHIDDGDRVLNKPVLFTEFGLSDRRKHFNHSHRDVFYKSIYNMIYKSAKKKRSGAGAFVWQLMVQGMEEYNDDFGFVPETRPSIYKLIKEHSCRLAKLNYGKDLHKTRFMNLCLE